MKQRKVSVLLDEAEYERFRDFCRNRGYKKSTLISKLIRDFLTSEDHEAVEIRSTAEAKKSSLK
jgi:metal-responsive CopG/Arc/MetJ family transcriptional regulator